MAKDALSCGIREVSKVAEMFIRQINGIARPAVCSVVAVNIVIITIMIIILLIF
jgi:hypothetical protein